MKKLIYLIFLLIITIGIGQPTCSDYDFTLTLEKMTPTPSCYEKLRLTVGTNDLRNGLPLVNPDFTCNAVYSGAYESFIYTLQIIKSSDDSIVAEKIIIPEEYNFIKNGKYFYLLDFDDFSSFSEEFYGKIAIEHNYHIIVDFGGYLQCDALAVHYLYNNECLSNQVSGCPPPQPNLRLKALSVNNNGQNYNLSQGQVPNIYFGENATFEVTIENNGNATANSSPFELYASAYRNAFAQNHDVYQFASGDGGSIPAGSTKKVTVYNTFYEYVGSLSLVNNNIYRIYSFMDHVNRVPESDESLVDNVREFPWKFIKTGSNTDPGGEEPCILCPTDDTGRLANSINPPYPIEIYNFTGMLYASAEVNNEKEAQKVVQALPKGLYIIKTPFGDRKISKE